MDTGRPLIATYLDTSAVLRILRRHGNLVPVVGALRDGAVSSLLLRIETWTAIWKLWHESAVNERERDRLLESSGSEVLDAVELLVLDDAVVTEALAVAERYPVRTLDGLHLATARIAGRRMARRGGSLRFCTADLRQAEIARSLLGPQNVDLLPPWR